jgi:transposase
MSSQRFSPEFKEEAVRQIADRGYAVSEVSERLGVSAHSLYKGVKAVKPNKSERQAAELIEAKKRDFKAARETTSDRRRARHTKKGHAVLC